MTAAISSATHPTMTVPVAVAPQPAAPPNYPAPAAAAPPVGTPIAPPERDVEFQVDKGTGRTVISVVNRATGEVVRQIPDEVVLRIARYLDAESGGYNVIDTSA